MAAPLRNLKNETKTLEQVNRVEKEVLRRIPTLILVSNLDGEIERSYYDRAARLITKTEGCTDKILPVDHLQLIETCIQKDSAIGESEFDGKQYEWRYLLHETKDKIYLYGWEISRYIRRIAQLQKQVEELAARLTMDQTTKLHNQRFFLNKLKEEIGYAKGHSKHNFAVLMIDVDEFKRFNDEEKSYEVGTEALLEVAAAIQRAVRRPDTVARKFGDEFLVILSGIGRTKQLGVRSTVELLAEKIRQEIDQLPPLGKRPPKKVTVSIGAYIHGGQPRSIESILNKAEKALWKAKEKRNSVEYFDDSQSRPSL